MCRKAANVRAENADDISKLLEFFKECKKENPKFYWDIKVDEEGIVKNVFLEPREYAGKLWRFWRCYYFRHHIQN
jgi:hypothetical protein